MGLLRDPAVTRSHTTWKNLATHYGRFCVQKRTEEGLNKITKLRHRWFYSAEDLFPFRIIYSTHSSDFNDALPAPVSTGMSALFPRSATEGSSAVGTSNAAYGTRSASSPVSGFTNPAVTAASDEKDGLVDSLLHWWSGSGPGSETTDSTVTASPPSASTNFYSFLPFSSPAPPLERFTVATSTQLSGILEAWGLLLEAWEPEEAELNVLSFASPAMASPTTTRAAMVGNVPLLERWRRTYNRISVLSAERGVMEGSTTAAAVIPATPPSPPLSDSVVGSTPASAVSLLRMSQPTSHVRRGRGGGEAGDTTPEPADTRSFVGRRHVHVSDDHNSPDSPAPLAIAHFFDVLLVRVVDLLMWRDPQLTACCLGILVSVYSHSAWANALCYLAGGPLPSSSPYCYAASGRTGDGHALAYAVPAERLWWGAPLFMISVLAFPWTAEQRRRVVTLTDRERLRSVDHALRWLSATDTGEATIETASEKDGSPCEAATATTVLVDVAKRVCAVLKANRLPISFLFLFNVIGAFSSWEVILVLFLWPMLIVSVCLAGFVVAVEYVRNQ